MNTLHTAPVAPLLDRLFKEAEGTPNIAFESISNAERLRLMQSKTEYLDFYSSLKDLWLPVSRETGNLLYMLARSSHAKTIVEFGTSFGISTLHLAAALRDNGGGKLITTEFEASKIVKAREHIKAGGLLDIVEFRQGDALQTLKDNLPDRIDFLLLDGAKGLYADILNLLEDRLKVGALIIADNTDYCPEYMQHICNPENGYLSVAFGDDVEVSMKL